MRLQSYLVLGTYLGWYTAVAYAPRRRPVENQSAASGPTKTTDVQDHRLQPPAGAPAQEDLPHSAEEAPNQTAPSALNFFNRSETRQ